MSNQPKEPVEFTAELVAMGDPHDLDVSQHSYDDTALLVFVAAVEEVRKAAPLFRTQATLSTGGNADAEREKYARALAANDALRAERYELQGDAEAYVKTLAYLSTVGAKGHDVSGDAQQGIASLVEQRDAERARADRALKVLRDLAAKYEPSANSHGVAYNTSPAAAAEWRAVAELLASEGSR